jgi:hypothetical protein
MNTFQPRDEVRPAEISFFGDIRFGRIADPLKTADGVLAVASLEDPVRDQGEDAPAADERER